MIIAAGIVAFIAVLLFVLGLIGAAEALRDIQHHDD